MSPTGLQPARSTGSLHRPLSDKLENSEGRRQKADQKARGNSFFLLPSAFCLFQVCRTISLRFYSVKVARRVNVKV